MVAYETSSENDGDSVKVGKTIVCVTQRPVLCEGRHLGRHWKRHCGESDEDLQVVVIYIPC